MGRPAAKFLEGISIVLFLAGQAGTGVPDFRAHTHTHPNTPGSSHPQWTLRPLGGERTSRVRKSEARAGRLWRYGVRFSFYLRKHKPVVCKEQIPQDQSHSDR